MIEHDKGCKFSCEQKREDEVYLIAPVFLHLDCSSVSNAFFLGEKKKMFLNFTSTTESDGRGTGQFYYTIHVFLTQHQSIIYVWEINAVTYVFTRARILFNYTEHQWCFPTLFPQLFFCLGISY